MPEPDEAAGDGRGKAAHHTQANPKCNSTRRAPARPRRVCASAEACVTVSPFADARNRLDMTAILPPFSLVDMAGENFTFPTPGARPVLLCFVKEDCPTCNLVMPLLQALHESGDVEVLAPGTLPKTEFKAKRVRDDRVL